MKRVLTLAIGLVLLLACVGTVSANLVANGGFESPEAGYPWTTYYAGNGLTGWTINTESIDLIHDYWQSKSGSQSIDLAGDKPAIISQAITTEIGEKYELKFWLAGNPFSPGKGLKGMNVYWDGNNVKSITFDTTDTSIQNMGWTLVTISDLKATQTTTVIAFEQTTTDNPAVGVALDDISVEPIVIPAPEFPSMALPATMLVGFMGFILYVQKSKKD